MKDNLTSKQKINAELAARSDNIASFKQLKHHTPATEQPGLKIAFGCECSDTNCSTRINLTLQEYGKLHDDFARFVIAKDHIEPSVEKITKKVKGSDQDLVVVEKYALTDFK